MSRDDAFTRLWLCFVRYPSFAHALKQSDPVAYRQLQDLMDDRKRIHKQGRAR